MRFLVLARFPEAVRQAVAVGVVGRGLSQGHFTVDGLDLTDFGLGKHRKIDDKPFGGGVGLVLRADVLIPAIRWAREQLPGAPVVMMTPQGEPAKQEHVQRLSQSPGAIFLCGRYEGFDERIRAHVDLELSVGDFVLSGGELAAACMIDAAARLIPGVLGNIESSHDESHNGCLLEHPQYTQPAEFEGDKVPDVLRSGDHGAVATWRMEQARQRTQQRRPDLYSAYAKGQEAPKSKRPG
ncbi:MAG: tRNA (guanosine(37)-N1)-methyltransferase TrmD [Myxococcota bacterium]|nr:tRNA (guanosine(37)-N1)-methyltransferase TrmD [Myxococcota bacterium]